MNEKKPKAALTANQKKIRKVWQTARPVAILLLSVLIAFGGIYLTVSIMIHKYLSPVDANDATPIEFTIESGWGASTIAKHLFEACGEGQKGLITNKAVFKIYVDFMGKSKELRAGTYFLSKNMDVPTIIDVLCKGGTNIPSDRVTIPEGTTVEGIAEILAKSEIQFDKERFLELCKSGTNFTKYSFIEAIIDSDTERYYVLEGYLFPDTYDFFMNATTEDIITKMLDRFENVFFDGEVDFSEIAAQRGMSIDEVIALATIIEREAVVKEDFYRVSSVFHNRLNNDMKLQSDAPLAYIFRENDRKLLYSEEEKQVDSPYNTYVNKGVTLPICNPGKQAIDSALNPDTEYVTGGYFYFCLKDKKTGALAYAKTLEEHNKNIELYRDNW
ncbi:MAG: endolytic transglycosylase MltG [Clostridiales bacterium]|nr:endolytic transglycosylase MltG [Clostridiales bacterium]